MNGKEKIKEIKKGCGKDLGNKISCGSRVSFGMYNHTRLILCTECAKKKLNLESEGEKE